MKFLVKKGIALKQKTACLVFGVFEGKLQGELLVELDQQAGGSYMQAVRSKEFTGAKGESLLLHGGAQMVAERVLLVGLGKESAISLQALRQTASDVTKLLSEKKLASFVLALPQLGLAKVHDEEMIQALAEGVLLADYRFDRYQTKNKPGKPED